MELFQKGGANMEKEIFIRGRKITYFDEGQGSPFLIIHGWGPKAVSQFFLFQKILASYGYRVILLDLPGFRKSGFPKWEMEEYVKCILDFVDKINLNTFFLIGHSMGGTIAIGLAATHPERIKSLILLSPGVIRFNIWLWRLFIIFIYGWMVIVKIWELLLALFVNIFKNLTHLIIKIIRLEKAVNWLKDFLKKTVETTMNRLDLARVRYQLIKILKHIAKSADTLSYLPKIKCPALAIWGEKDYNFNFLFIGGARFMGRIPNCIIELIPEAGHQLPEDAPERTIELIIDFIKKLDN
jgi:pimeloyl-ACP methyl ester carboxylesterase